MQQAEYSTGSPCGTAIFRRVSASSNTRPIKPDLGSGTSYFASAQCSLHQRTASVLLMPELMTFASYTQEAIEKKKKRAEARTHEYKEKQKVWKYGLEVRYGIERNDMMLSDAFS